jgi:PleD family two-component response regulator
VPVLMLTARGDDVDRISGLNLGADDYVLVHRASSRHGSVRSALAWRSHDGRQNGTVVRQPRKTRRLGVCVWPSLFQL